MVSEDKVDRVALTQKVKNLKSQIQDFEKQSDIPGLQKEANTLKQNPAESARFKTLQSRLDLWKRITSGLHDLEEMMLLVAPPDSRSLDEDRCNWWILQEDAEELERNLEKFAQFKA